MRRGTGIVLLLVVLVVVVVVVEEVRVRVDRRVRIRMEGGRVGMVTRRVRSRNWSWNRKVR